MHKFTTIFYDFKVQISNLIILLNHSYENICISIFVNEEKPIRCKIFLPKTR